MDVLSPKLVPMRSNTNVKLPIIKAQKSRSIRAGTRSPLTTIAAA